MRARHPEIPDRPRALCCPIHLTPGYTTSAKKNTDIKKRSVGNGSDMLPLTCI